MPKSRRATPPRSTQIDDAPWERFGDAAKVVGMSRAGLMKALVLWFIQWPGAKLPERPTRAAVDAAAAERIAAEDADESSAS